jgi:membrane protein
LRPLQVLLTVAMVAMVGLVAMSLALTGTVAHAVGAAIGIGNTPITVWNFAKWPFIVAVVTVMFSLLYWAAPNIRQPRFRGVSAGGVVGVILWVVASALFGVYLARFGSDNATYGSLGGVIGCLMWLWISNLALLFGVVLNAELERKSAADGSSIDVVGLARRSPAGDDPGRPPP